MGIWKAIREGIDAANASPTFSSAGEAARAGYCPECGNPVPTKDDYTGDRLRHVTCPYQGCIGRLTTWDLKTGRPYR